MTVNFVTESYYVDHFIVNLHFFLRADVMEIHTLLEAVKRYNIERFVGIFNR